MLDIFGCGIGILAQAGSDANELSTDAVQSGGESVQEIMQNVYSYLAQYGLDILAAIIILVVGCWVSKLLSKIAGKFLERSSIEPTLVKFLTRFVYLGLMVFVIVAALAKLGVQTASIIAVVGAAGLAVGLALQGSLANFAAGILLLVFRPFKAGDFIAAAGTMGTVVEVHIFTTILNSFDNVRVIVPNAQITAGNIVNYSTNGTRRVDMVVGVSYEDDLAKAKDIISRIVSSDSRVLSEPATVVAVSELADSSVNFVVRPWVNSSDYWAVKFDLTERIKNALDEGGITIPFPQHDVHIKGRD